jgi:uncharacterized damage-inducible protein DinB
VEASTFREIVQGQFAAALRMFDKCLQSCPEEHWNEPVGTLPFWHVAFHALRCTDMYLSASRTAWHDDIHSRLPVGAPKPRRPHIPDHPYSRAELVTMSKACRARLRATLNAETDRSLAAKSGFSWISSCRAEVYLYNLRHFSGHVGQLTAFLWKRGVETPWVSRAR